MPSLRLFGRPWRTSTDVLAVPCLFGSSIAVCYIAVFGGIAAHFKLWSQCGREGKQYIAISVGLFLVFALSLLNQIVISLISFRGSPLEVSKRALAEWLLYLQCFIWVCEAVLVVFGTAVIAHVEPHCRNVADEDGVRNLTRAMVATTWAVIGIVMLAILLVYSLLPDNPTVETWEKCCSTFSRLLGCYHVVSQEIQGRAAPLTRIAELMAGLFGSADLTPTDIVTALVLTAAAQTHRRKLRIRRALARSADSESAMSSRAPSTFSSGGSLASSLTELSEEEAGSGPTDLEDNLEEGEEDGPMAPPLQMPSPSRSLGGLKMTASASAARAKGKGTGQAAGGPPLTNGGHTGNAAAVLHAAGLQKLKKEHRARQRGARANPDSIEAAGQSDADAAPLTNAGVGGGEGPAGALGDREAPAEYSRADAGAGSAGGAVGDNPNSGAGLWEAAADSSHAGGRAGGGRAGNDTSGSVVSPTDIEQAAINVSGSVRSTPRSPVVPPGSALSDLDWEPPEDRAALEASSSGDVGPEADCPPDAQAQNEAAARRGMPTGVSGMDTRGGSAGPGAAAQGGEGGRPLEEVLGDLRSGLTQPPRPPPPPVAGPGEPPPEGLAAKFASISTPPANGGRQAGGPQRGPSALGGEGGAAGALAPFGGLQRTASAEARVRATPARAGGSAGANARTAASQRGSGEGLGRGSASALDEVEQRSVQAALSSQGTSRASDSGDLAPGGDGSLRGAGAGTAKGGTWGDRPDQQGGPSQDEEGGVGQFWPVARIEARHVSWQGDVTQQGVTGSPGSKPARARRKTPSADDLSELLSGGSGGFSRAEGGEARPGDESGEASGSEISFAHWYRGSAGSLRSQGSLAKKKNASADDVARLGRQNPLKSILKKSASADNLLGKRSGVDDPLPFSLRPSFGSPSGRGRKGRRSDSIEGMPKTEEGDRQKSISLADIDAETLEQLLGEQEGGGSDEAEAGGEADQGSAVEALFVPSDAGSASVSRSGWIPRALRAGMLDEDLLARPSGAGGDSLNGDPVLDALSPAVESFLPSVVTPSKEAVSVLEDGAPEGNRILPAEEYLGERKTVSKAALEEALDYARFALAVYYVQSVEDDNLSCYGRKAKPPFRPHVTTETVTKDILRLAEIHENDLLYFSHYNEALTHLPYLIALNRRRKAVVVALRGTMSLADVVTDAVAVPERVDGWLPKGVLQQARQARRKRKAFAHSGMVAITQQLEIDLNKNGILPALLYGKREVLQQFLATLSVSERTKLEGWVGRGDKDAQGDRGESVGLSMQELHTEGWRLVITGHSLGAGAATLLALKLRDNFKDIKCWAFSPPALMSKNLMDCCRDFCTAVVVGKDAVPRASINNLSRLMDEMITSLARCRQPKLRVLFGGWWKQEKRPPPEKLFYTNVDIPEESMQVLERYFKRVDRKGKAREMYPPGPIMFVRPLKHLVRADNGRKSRSGFRIKRTFDAVWITPQELISEGILVSSMMMKDHLLESNVLKALRYAARHSSGGDNLQGAGVPDGEASSGPDDDARFQRGDDVEGATWEPRDSPEESSGDLEAQFCDDPSGLEMRMCEEGTAKMSVPSPTSAARIPTSTGAPHGAPPRHASRQSARSVTFGPHTSF